VKVTHGYNRTRQQLKTGMEDNTANGRRLLMINSQTTNCPLLTAGLKGEEV
jgi:hypothetical protein